MNFAALRQQEAFTKNINRNSLTEKEKYAQAIENNSGKAA